MTSWGCKVVCAVQWRCWGQLRAKDLWCLCLRRGCMVISSSSSVSASSSPAPPLLVSAYLSSMEGRRRAAQGFSNLHTVLTGRHTPDFAAAYASQLAARYIALSLPANVSKYTTPPRQCGKNISLTVTGRAESARTLPVPERLKSIAQVEVECPQSQHRVLRLG